MKKRHEKIKDDTETQKQGKGTQMHRSFLPHVELSTEDKERLHKIMVNGSAALGRCVMEFYNDDNRSKRIEFVEMLYSDLLDVSAFNADDIQAIFAVKEIEAQVLMGYTKSIRKLVNYYQGSTYGDVIQKETFADVAEDYARWAMYFFEDRGVDFHTFMQTMVKNALADLVRTQATRNSTAKVFCASQILPADGTWENEHGRELKHFDPVQSTPLYSEEELAHLHEAIDHAGLTPMERQLFDAYLAHGDAKQGSKEKGYIKRIMSNYINQRTGRPFSAFQGVLLLRKAKKKVIETYVRLFKEVA